jgi:hypothetical protein
VERAEVGEGGWRFAQGVAEKPGQPQPGGRSNEGDGDGLADEQAKDLGRREADGFEDADLARPLSHAHGHGVGRDEKHGEGDGAGDHEEEELHVAEEGEEAELEGVLGFGLRLHVGIAKQIVYLFRDSLDQIGGTDVKHEDGDTIHAVAAAEAFVQVFKVEEEVLVVGGGVVDAADDEVERHGEDVADDLDAVAHFESEASGELAADDAGTALALKGEAFGVGEFEFRIDAEEAVGLDGDAAEEVAGVARVLQVPPNH